MCGRFWLPESSVKDMPVCVKPEPKDTSRDALSKTPQQSQAETSSGCSTAPETQPFVTPVSQSSSTGVSSSSQQTNGTVPSAALQSSIEAASEKEKATTVPEDAIDYDSVRGVFGWATLDDINVPYIIRKYRKFLAVRIVEKKVLNKYPNSFPDELGKKEPLVSYFVTEAEANLLNEINTVHCSFEYGSQPFTTKDLIVDLAEFEDFYNLVKKTFPEDVLATITADDKSGSSEENKNKHLSKVCGWMQINNTVTPYIIRSAGKFVPLSVMQYAAQLLTKDHVLGHLPTADECCLLNETCKVAGFDFSFGKNTKLIHIAEVLQRCPVSVFPLPFENPLAHAQYIDTETVGAEPPSPLPSVGAAGSMALPYQTKPGMNEGPPNLNPFTEYNPFVSMMSMTMSPMSNHMLPRNSGLGPSVAVPAGPQLSLVPTQTAPILFPPAPHSVARMTHMNGNSGLTVVEGPQSQAVIPQRTAVIPGSRPVAPQGLVGPSSLATNTGPNFQGHGGSSGSSIGISLSSVSGGPSHPHFPEVSHRRQQSSHLGPPAVSDPRAAVPHHMVSSRLIAQQDSVVVPEIGQVPGSIVPMTGFPPRGVAPGETPRHMGMPRSQLGPHMSHQLESRSRLLLQQPHVQPLYKGNLQSPTQLASTMVPSQTSSSMFLSSVPTTVNSVPSGFHVQMNTGTGTPNRDCGANLASAAAVSVPERSARGEEEDHLKLVGDIKPEMVNGKSISCIKRNSPERKGSFCLVEAVAKLYFPKCNLSEFVNALQNVLGITLPVCSEQEAKAFIHFYNLPVANLNDNHMICLQDLKNYFPQILYMFRHSSLETSNLSSQSQPLCTRRFSSLDTTKLASPSAPITVSLNSNDRCEVISIDTGPSTPSANSPGVADAARQATKRRAEDSGAGVSKHVRPSLEQTRPRKIDEMDRGASKVADTSTSSSKASGHPPTSSSQVIFID